MLIDCDPRKTVFRGPSTFGVSLAFVTTNIGSLGFTKHTVLIKHSQYVLITGKDSFHKKIKNIFDTDQNLVIHIDPLH